MINFGKKSIKILERMAFMETFPNTYDETHLKIDCVRVLTNDDLDISEHIVIYLIEKMGYKDLNESLYFNALKGALYLLNEAKMFSSSGRELHTIDYLVRHDSLAETLTAICFISKFYESCGEGNTIALLKEIIRPCDIESVIEIYRAM